LAEHEDRTFASSILNLSSGSFFGGMGGGGGEGTSTAGKSSGKTDEVGADSSGALQEANALGSLPPTGAASPSGGTKI
jgi:hypothetical protein